MFGSVFDRCGICFGDGSTCADNFATCYAFGTYLNTHFTTFDGFTYDYAGTCVYTLAHDCEQGLFTVQAQYLSSGWHLVVQYMYDTIEIAQDNSALLNKTTIVTLPYVSNDVIIFIDNVGAHIQLNAGLSIDRYTYSCNVD